MNQMQRMMFAVIATVTIGLIVYQLITKQAASALIWFGLMALFGGLVSVTIPGIRSLALIACVAFVLAALVLLSWDVVQVKTSSNFNVIPAIVLGIFCNWGPALWAIGSLTYLVTLGISRRVARRKLAG